MKVYTAHTVDMISKDFAALAVADDATNLAFKVSGQVVAFDVTEGQSVAKGTVVAQINPRDYRPIRRPAFGLHDGQDAVRAHGAAACPSGGVQKRVRGRTDCLHECAGRL
ncbi:MAG: biotin/lipoyl-binding protein [Alistipes putredinis]|nr:MAG: biotin/lipoyl-binding protein [Alistipes putredinis]